MERKYWGEKKSPAPKSAQPNGGKPEKHISVHENKIYYYAGVNRDSASELNKKIGELESKSLTLCNTLDLDQPPTCRIYINSGGGSVVSGISSMNTTVASKYIITPYLITLKISINIAMALISLSTTCESLNSYLAIIKIQSAT